MLKVQPHPDYPPEEGRYVRGNDASPVAVAVVLNCDADKVPSDLERLVRVGVESGAALSGTVQTENIGLEKIVCNVVANPNIRYMVLAGPESDGHSTGEALKALIANGVDQKKRIIGTRAPHPFLYNLPIELINRFRKQTSLVDVQFEADPDVIRQAVWSCYQEEPVAFRGLSLYDPGAYPEPPLAGKITWPVTQPWYGPMDERGREAVEKARALIERLKKRTERQNEK
jgi:tetrahydromethanopterin S-methyltransferase subunit A